MNECKPLRVGASARLGGHSFSGGKLKTISTPVAVGGGNSGGGGGGGSGTSGAGGKSGGGWVSKILIKGNSKLPYVTDVNFTRVGSGKGDFKLAKGMMEKWGHFQLGWSHVDPSTVGFCFFSAQLEHL